MSAARPAEINPYLGAQLESLARDVAMLDVGCGDGYWLATMTAIGFAPLGLEPDPARAADARAIAPVTVGDGMGMPFPAAAFDAVWCIHILHHLDEPDAALAEMARVLRPGGRLLIAETVEDNPLIRLARRVHPHWDDVPVRSRFTAARLAERLAEHGFAIEWQHRHSLIAFAAFLLPARQRRIWRRVVAAEQRLASRASKRWGAHVEFVATRL